MKKPLSKWAIFMWVVAVAYLLGAFAAYRAASHYGAFEGMYLLNPSILEGLFSGIVRPTLFSAPLMIGVGVLIEKVDQIRWSALSADDRLAIKSKRSLIASLRRWPE